MQRGADASGGWHGSDDTSRNARVPGPPKRVSGMGVPFQTGAVPSVAARRSTGAPVTPVISACSVPVRNLPTFTNIKGFLAAKPDLMVTVDRADLNRVMMGVEILPGTAPTQRQVPPGRTFAVPDSGLIQTD